MIKRYLLLTTYFSRAVLLYQVQIPLAFFKRFVSFQISNSGTCQYRCTWTRCEIRIANKKCGNVYFHLQPKQVHSDISINIFGHNCQSTWYRNLASHNWGWYWPCYLWCGVAQCTHTRSRLSPVYAVLSVLSSI